MAKARKLNIGLYTLLPIPHAPQMDISLDFVLGLPWPSRAHGSILVVVNLFSKLAHFIVYSKTDDAYMLVN